MKTSGSAEAMSRATGSAEPSVVPAVEFGCALVSPVSFVRSAYRGGGSAFRCRHSVVAAAGANWHRGASPRFPRLASCLRRKDAFEGDDVLEAQVRLAVVVSLAAA